jgi:hypothetical protein
MLYCVTVLGPFYFNISKNRQTLVLKCVFHGYKFQSRSSTGQNMPKENRLFIRSTFRTEHSINLTYLVHKISPRWRKVSMVIERTTRWGKKLLQRIQMWYKYREKFKVGQRIYEMIASNFLLNLIPKELLYMKNNHSKYELKLSATLGMPHTYYDDMRQKPLACYAHRTALKG